MLCHFMQIASCLHEMSKHFFFRKDKKKKTTKKKKNIGLSVVKLAQKTFKISIKLE